MLERASPDAVERVRDGGVIAVEEEGIALWFLGNEVVGVDGIVVQVLGVGHDWPRM